MFDSGSARSALLKALPSFIAILPCKDVNLRLPAWAAAAAPAGLGRLLDKPVPDLSIHVDLILNFKRDAVISANSRRYGSSE